jgi:uncharacterized protein
MTTKNSIHATLGLLLALGVGVLFAAGLVVSGMTQPARVIGFLNLAGLFTGPFPGQWDPSLAFVMGGAVMVTLVAFAVSDRPGHKPWFAERFVLPTRQDIDRPLILGAALFGVGWGLSGYCPGPALASLLLGGVDVALFLATMAIGMGWAKWLRR